MDRPSCTRRVAVYEGSIGVASTGYRHTVARAGDYVDAPVEDLDRVVSPARRVRFTLDYPFEKPFDGVLTGEVTRRAVIDAVRSGFRKMYAGSEVREIPGMANKDVRGPYGRSFHAIDDLVIERVDLCDDLWLDIDIGS